MAARDAELRRLAARAGAGARNHLPDAAERQAALAEARLAHVIQRVVSDAPALTGAQRDRLAALLRPGSAGAGEGRVAS